MTPDPAATLERAKHVAWVIARSKGLVRLLGNDGVESAANLAAAYALKTWDPQRCPSFDTYLGTKVRHQLIDDIRKAHGRRTHHPELVALTEETAIDDLDRTSTGVEQFLATLKPRDRWIVECHAAGMTPAPIGAALGLTAWAITQRMVIIRRSLRCFAAA